MDPQASGSKYLSPKTFSLLGYYHSSEPIGISSKNTDILSG